MANINSLVGLVPVRRLDGLSVNFATNIFYVDPAETVDLRAGDPVVVISGASPDGKYRACRRALPADASLAGVVVDIHILENAAQNATNLLPHEGDTLKFRAAGAQTEGVYVKVITDPQALYEVQEYHAPDYLNIAASAAPADGETRWNEDDRVYEQYDLAGLQWNVIYELPSVTAIAAAGIGLQYPITNDIDGNGAFSAVQLDADNVGAVPSQLEIMWLQRKPSTYQATQFFGASAGNSLGQFAKFVVRIVDHQFAS
jgi:hypothetical protein